MEWLEQVKEDLKQKRLERDEALLYGPDIAYIKLSDDVRWLKDYIKFLESI